MRMPKGWMLVGTNGFEFGNAETRSRRMRRDHRANKAIRNCVKLKYEDLEKEGYEARGKAVAREEALRTALNAGKLRSPRLIKEAKA